MHINVTCTGFFKVRRGVNEVGIESSAVAGMPSPNRIGTPSNGDPTNGNSTNTGNSANGDSSLNKGFGMLMMLWIIMSLLAVIH